MPRHPRARRRTTPWLLLLLSFGCAEQADPPGPAPGAPAERELASMGGAPLSAERELASVDGVQLSAQAFRAYLDVARAPGYRPATRAEAVRLLRARLGLLALDAVLAKREEEELTSTALLEELLTARGAGSRQDVFDDLLAQARVEVDHAGLLAFVRQEPTGAPPMPPGYAR